MAQQLFRQGQSDKRIEALRQQIYGNIPEQAGVVAQGDIQAQPSAASDGIPVRVQSDDEVVDQENEDDEAVEGYSLVEYVPPTTVVHDTSIYEGEINTLRRAVHAINELLPVRCLQCYKVFSGITAESFKMMTKGIGNKDTNPYAKAAMAIELLMTNSYSNEDENGKLTMATSSDWHVRLFNMITASTTDAQGTRIPTIHNIQSVLYELGVKLRSADDAPTQEDMSSPNRFIRYIIGDEIFLQYLMSNLTEKKALSILGVSRDDIDTVENIRTQWKDGTVKLNSELRASKIKLFEHTNSSRKAIIRFINLVELWSDNQSLPYIGFSTRYEFMDHVAKHMISLRPTQSRHIMMGRYESELDPKLKDGTDESFLKIASDSYLYDDHQNQRLKSLIVTTNIYDFAMAWFDGSRIGTVDMRKLVDLSASLVVKSDRTVDLSSIHKYIGISPKRFKQFQIWRVFRSIDVSTYHVDTDNVEKVMYQLYQKLGGGKSEFDKLMNIVSISTKSGNRWMMFEIYGLSVDELATQVMGYPSTVESALRDLTVVSEADEIPKRWYARDEAESQDINSAFIELMEEVNDLASPGDASPGEDEEEDDESDDEDESPSKPDDDESIPSEWKSMTNKQHLQALGLSNNSIDFVMSGGTILSLVTGDVREYIKQRANMSASRALGEVMGDNLSKMLFNEANTIKPGMVSLRRLLTEKYYEQAKVRMTTELMFMISHDFLKQVIAAMAGGKGYSTAFSLLGNNATRVRMFMAMMTPGGKTAGESMDILGYKAVCCRTHLVTPPMLPKGAAYHNYQDTPGTKMYNNSIRRDMKETRVIQTKTIISINTSTLQSRPLDARSSTMKRFIVGEDDSVVIEDVVTPRMPSGGNVFIGGDDMGGWMDEDETVYGGGEELEGVVHQEYVDEDEGESDGGSDIDTTDDDGFSENEFD